MSVMEPEEIAVVLSRASKLHTKLSDAIHVVVENTSSSSFRIPGIQNGEAASEVRSLAAIRDSLEILEEQLESLQVLQQQQRADRDAGLAELEESRRVFLKLLSEYRGRELDVVQEALAFAGGDVLDKNEVSAQGHLSLSEEDGSPFSLGSFPRGRYGSVRSQESNEEQLSKRQVFGFDIDDPKNDEGSELDSAYGDDDFRDPDSLVRITMNAVNVMRKSVVNSRVFSFAFIAVRSSITFLGRLVGQVSAQVTGPPSKSVLIIASTLVVLSLTELGERSKSISRVSRMPAHRSHQHQVAKRGYQGSGSRSSQKPNSSRWFPTFLGKGKRIADFRNTDKLDDEFPRCVVRERLEVPFYQELHIPDALQGRG
ncbi:hypothetical protein KP509_22G026500 [Ceratopteris richardii]|uniref:Uncharacterized protein n=1 Tax=Ceratopteris richardii TaxID=49495 RepID=A0A8T2S4J1_CERRI|nr:hypothetical protein KP509_22G026500 [Ceratopteris richardii]